MKGLEFYSGKTNGSARTPSWRIFQIYFSFCDSPEASIAEIWTNQGWNIIFRRLLNDWEIESVASLLQRLNDFSGLNTSPDTIRWRHDRDRKFSVGRLYRRNLISQPGNIPGPWKQIWKSNIPTKIKCFTWKVCRRPCLTQEKLKKRGFEIVSRCFFARKRRKQITICSCIVNLLLNYDIYSKPSLK